MVKSIHEKLQMRAAEAGRQSTILPKLSRAKDARVSIKAQNNKKNHFQNLHLSILYGQKQLILIPFKNCSTWNNLGVA